MIRKKQKTNIAKEGYLNECLNKWINKLMGLIVTECDVVI